MLARITLLALYDYDESLFDGLELPNGISKENVVNATLDKGAIFGCIYTNPIFLKKYIEAWSKRHYSMFQRWIDVINSEYDPIRDYYIDRKRNIIGNEVKEGKEELSEVKTGKLDSNETYDRSRTVSELEECENEKIENEIKDYDETNYNERKINESKGKEGNTNNTSSGTTEEKVSAFDSTDYSPRTMTITNSNDNGTNNESEITNGTIDDGGGKQVDEVNKKNTTESGVIKDNVIEGISDVSITNENTSGATKNDNTINENKDTSESLHENVIATKGERSIQDLIKEEIELAKFEICEKIADMLVADICIMIY